MFAFWNVGESVEGPKAARGTNFGRVFYFLSSFFLFLTLPSLPLLSPPLCLLPCPSLTLPPLPSLRSSPPLNSAMISGGNSFNNYPENQLTKFRAVSPSPSSWYHLGDGIPPKMSSVFPLDYTTGNYAASDSLSTSINEKEQSETQPSTKAVLDDFENLMGLPCLWLNFNEDSISFFSEK